MKHIVGLSGGKDSTALALRLAEVEPRKYVYICNETGNELPDMKAHWDKLENILGEPIQRVRHARSLIEEIEKINMLPNVFARWCTIRLKIEPTLDYFESLPAGSTLYVGLRADEMERKGLYGEDITVRFPMREWNWNEKDVWDYLNSKGICIPKRTDCALCPYQRLGEWRDLYENYPDLYAEGVALEKKIGHTFRSPGRDNWPANLELLSKEFDAGRKLREYKRKDTCRVCSL
jgi:3'-phosphoadenosine 5'-phosphosulfate sulfotransferase (PAPS reductase)/FAD synthetase